MRISDWSSDVCSSDLDGTIDILSSGHDPRGPEDKRLPFAEALPGMAGAETLLALGLNLVRDGHISPGRLFELLAATPACLLGVDAGKLAVGKEADLILVDPDTPWQVDAKRMAAWEIGRASCRERVCPCV